VFFFDFKDDHPINLALDTIKKRNMQDRVILGAVIPEINRKLLKKKPKTIPLAADFETMQNIHAAFKQGTFGNLKVKHEIVGFMIDESRLALLDEQIFDAFKEKGKWIALFGPALDNEETIQKAISLGTHLILSDRPDVLRQILDKNV
jgi:glycerophosphoryl diester phosphodiesterase